MALSDAGRAAMAYWSKIQSLTAEHASTVAVWDSIREGQQLEPNKYGPVTLQGVNEIRSAAAQIRNTSDSLGKARALEERTGLAQ